MLWDWLLNIFGAVWVIAGWGLFLTILWGRAFQTIRKPLDGGDKRLMFWAAVAVAIGVALVVVE